ncbi:MAG TPA: ATP-binding cassette domain-containing protein [Candidatus Latescibacteria bacterium]|nr:ATP-binding cassette domain-containing protein [Candidatus Handelsmanbacteria bacterium]HIL10583.1 ATP-binding cassette domain-containing protein [Candidatus Latescibacterota bacterium]
MALINLRNATIAFGGPPILADISLRIERDERVCLYGRNGEGKSTLLKMLNGEIAPDSGELARANGLRTAYLNQDTPADLAGTVREIVAAGVKDAPDHQIDSALSRLSLDPNTNFDELSGGLKRRVLLARAIAAEPDVLLLDEPTNHLDIGSITYLEEFLLRWNGTVVFVTHDRALLRKLATRIIEIDRGQVYSFAENYETFLRRREERFATEADQAALFDHRLSEEEVWIRQGIKARRTRNEGRVRALEKMREERRKRRQHQDVSRLQVQQAERSGDLVLEVRDLEFGYGEESLVRDFSTIIGRGDKIGIIGRNGAGKTSLLQLILGQLKPRQGSVRHGTRLKIARFDQHREALNLKESVAENIAPGQEFLEINGQRRHVYGYLQDFLFTPERARTPVGVLSGGERNRLLLARILARPVNLLILDEPTNDLDVETLDLLEEQLVAYAGTLILVSHDRDFLDHVTTSTLVFEGDGKIGDYTGGYSDWRRLQQANPTPPKASNTSPQRKATAPLRKAKLSFNDRRELEALPGQIEDLESEQGALHQRMADPAFYQEGATAISTAKEQLDALEQNLATAYARWEALAQLEES